MKRRAAVEPGIGHLKQEHRMDRNRLKGTLGDRINAILSAAGMNFAKLVRAAALFLRQILGSWYNAGGIGWFSSAADLKETLALRLV